MTAEEIRKAQDEINREIIERSKAPNYKFDGCYILDGIADIDGYINSSPRIAWILKEAWGNDDEGWNLSSQVIAKQNSSIISSTPSFKRVAYVSRGIHTDTVWDDLPWINQDEDVASSIKKVAWLNISKIAGDTTSPDARITAAYGIWIDILRKQLNLFDPQIIILGNTHKWVEKMLKIERPKGEADLKENSAWAYLNPDNKLIIWAFHPSKIMKDEKYVDDIINVIRKAREKYKLNF